MSTADRSSPQNFIEEIVEEHNLRERYGSRLEAVYGESVAGPLRATLARIAKLELGDLVIDEPVTMLSLADAGALAERDVAGSVGNGVLMRYAVTFDFPGGALYFDKTAATGKRDSSAIPPCP